MTSIRRTRTKAVAWTAAGLALLGLSAAGAAQAASGPADPTTATQEVSDGDGETADDAQEVSDGDGETADDQESTITGTLAAPESATEQDDAAEQAALTGLANVTADQAGAAAVAAVPGTPGTAQLEDEDGWVVWSVVVTDTQGSATEVVVDAGTGKVLTTQADDGETADDAANG